MDESATGSVNFSLGQAGIGKARRLLAGTPRCRLPSSLVLRGYEHRADNMRMVKRLLRDLLGKRTERKALNPEVRTMLESLDGVYEPKSSRAASSRDSSADRTRQDSR